MKTPTAPEPAIDGSFNQAWPFFPTPDEDSLTADESTGANVRWQPRHWQKAGGFDFEIERDRSPAELMSFK